MSSKRTATKTRKAKPAKAPKPAIPAPASPSAQETYNAIRQRLSTARDRLDRNDAPFVIPAVHDAAIAALTRLTHLHPEVEAADIALMRECKKRIPRYRDRDEIETRAFAMQSAAARAMAEVWIAAYGYAAVDAAYRLR